MGRPLGRLPVPTEIKNGENSPRPSGIISSPADFSRPGEFAMDDVEVISMMTAPTILLFQQ